MIFIPAIVAGLAAAAKPVLVAVGVGAAVGGVTGAGAGAAVEILDGYQEHGEINREVLDEAARGAFDGAKDGALIGGAFGPVGLVTGPILSTVGGMVDDIAGPVVSKIGSALGSVVTSTGYHVATPYRMARSAAIARFYRVMPSVCNRGCVYLMDDTANGLQKIGVTTDPATRIGSVQRGVKSELTYVSISPVDDAFSLETSLRHQFASKNVTHPNYQKGREWFAGLSPLDVAMVMGS